MTRFRCSRAIASLGLAACALWLAVPALALAQRKPGNTLPPALQDVPPAGQCARDDSPPGEAAVPGAKAATDRPDLGCALAPSDVPAWAARAAPTWIDVRPLADHDAAHIAGATPMAPSTLKTKSVLRDRPIVLVGSGKGERELFVACAGLKADGFKDVRVLRGGLPGWVAAGQPLVGRTPDVAAVSRLSAPELWAESHFEGNLVLLAGTQAPMAESLVQAELLPELTPATVKAALERRRKQAPGAPVLGVVVVGDANSAGDEPAKRLQSAIAPLPLLAYAQGPARFVADMRVQQRMWTAQATGPKTLPCGR